MTDDRDPTSATPGLDDSAAPRDEHVARDARSADDLEPRQEAALEAPAAQSGSAPAPAPIDARMVEEVIRRATSVQLERLGRAPGGSETLDDRELMRIGSELGLEQEIVERALLEVRSERARPKVPVERGVAAALLGERFVSAGRTVARPAEDVQKALESQLAHVECLAEVRRIPGASMWVPATGLASRIQRGLNLGRRAYLLSRIQGLTARVTKLDEHNALVTLTADIGNVRREKTAKWSVAGALLVLPGAAALLGLLLGDPTMAVAGGAAGAGAAAVSGTRGAVRRERARLGAALDGMLDRLELEERP